MVKTLQSDLGLLLLRVAPSALLLTHGYPKFQKLLSGDFEFGDPLGIGSTPTLFLAVIAEFICPILMIVGYKTRWVALPTVITMAVIVLMVHGADPFGDKELPLLYLAAFLCVMFLGPGKYSIDRR